MHDADLLARDYRWFPYRINPSTGQLHVIKAERADHRAVTFLDDQFLSRATEQGSASLTGLAEAIATPEAQSHFIFHTAFCCSTLLARALDVPGASMGLKEPLVLNDLAAAAIAARRADIVRPLLGPVLNLLSRPFSANEAVVIKPSNVVNPLIAEIMGQPAAGAALFMSSPLDDFLRSVAKKGLFGRIWARRQMKHIDRLIPGTVTFSEDERWEHSDLQVAALVWMRQRAQFARIIADLPDGRAASLESTVLLADPRAAISALVRLFALNITEEQVEEIVTGPIFQTDSKSHGQAHDPQQRRSSHKQLDDLLGDEIRMVVSWAEKIAEYFKLEIELPKPLVVTANR